MWTMDASKESRSSDMRSVFGGITQLEVLVYNPRLWVLQDIYNITYSHLKFQ